MKLVSKLFEIIDMAKKEGYAQEKLIVSGDEIKLTLKRKNREKNKIK